MTLATGHLSSLEPGVMTGRVTFPVRGTFDLTMDLAHNEVVNDHTYRIARFRCGRDQCDVWWLNLAKEGVDMGFWGQIVLEGYTLQVAIRAGDSGMNVEFIDAVQPLAVPAEWGDAA